jgi:beta-glucanase (GH16 family)
MGEWSRRWVSFLFAAILVLALATLPAGAAPKPDKPGGGNGGGGGGGGKGGGKGGSSSQPWEENFDGPLDTSFWTVPYAYAPGYRAGVHLGYYEPANVTVQNGYLVLKLYQTTGDVDGNPDGVISHGALVSTVNTYGYGTYEWRMRMSSTGSDPDASSGWPVSGSVSAGFLYVNNSQTEIDFEFSGHLVGTGADETLYMVNWYNVHPRNGPASTESTVSSLWLPGLNTEFHDCKFVWEPGKITYFVDGVLRATHTTNVPSAPANLLINHWGTDNANGWGGAATLGVERWYYIDWVRYTPLP